MEITEKVRKVIQQETERVIIQSLDMQNKLTAARLRIINLEQLIQSIEITNGSITAPETTWRMIEHEQGNIKKLNEIRYKQKLPYNTEEEDARLDAEERLLSIGVQQCHEDGKGQAER